MFSQISQEWNTTLLSPAWAWNTTLLSPAWAGNTKLQDSPVWEFILPLAAIGIASRKHLPYCGVLLTTPTVAFCMIHGAYPLMLLVMFFLSCLSRSTKSVSLSENRREVMECHHVDLDRDNDQNHVNDNDNDCIAFRVKQRRRQYAPSPPPVIVVSKPRTTLVKHSQYHRDVTPKKGRPPLFRNTRMHALGHTLKR